MVNPSRRDLFLGVTGTVFPGRGVRADVSATPPVNWDQVRTAATTFVEKESPENVWPFERADRARSRGEQKIAFFHYFTPFPLSIENAPFSSDYYTTQYLRPEGEGGKFAYAGGYIRERPLSVGPWNSRDWREINLAIEVLRAQKIGGDGFGVDILALLDGSRYWRATEGLYDVAANVAPDFKILAEPDTDALKGAPPSLLVETLTRLAKKPAAFRLRNGRFVLAPFDPVQWPPEQWALVLSALEQNGVPALLLPILLNPGVDAKRFRNVSSGMSEWGQRDRPDILGDDSRMLWKRLTSGLGPNWMQPIAPQDFRPKAAIFWEAGNTDAFRAAWMRAINDHTQLVHLITWNDYSEATELSPSTGTRYLFYDLCSYFLSWWKSGNEPKITRDAIYFCYRRVTLSTAVPNKPAPNMNLLGSEPIKNEIEMIALVTEPAIMEIELNQRTSRKMARPGLNILKAPAAIGRPEFRIVRGDQTIVEARGSEAIAPPSSAPIDALYYGGSSTRSNPRRPSF